MEPELIYSLPSSCSNTGGPLAVGVFMKELVVARATNSDINLHYMYNGRDLEEVVLRGHYQDVTALVLSESPVATSSTLLCSVSMDAMLLWDIAECLGGQGIADSSKRLPLSEGVVHHMTFSEDIQLLAVCKGQEVVIYNIQSCVVDTTLVGHSAAVTCASFSPHHPHRTIISASEDRTFKIWDLESSCLLYQSAVVSASPFLCLSVSKERAVMATGSADGMLRVYDLTEGGGYRCLLKCDISKEIEKMGRKKSPPTNDSVGIATINSMGPWHSTQGHVTQVTPTVDVGPVILSLCHSYPIPSGDMNFDPPPHTDSSAKHIKELLQSPPTLVVISHTHLLLLNANTLEPLDSLDLRDPLTSSDVVPSVTAAATLIITTNRCYCGLVGMFSSSITVLSVRCSINFSMPEADDALDNCLLSVLSNAPLVPNSPLRAVLTVRESQPQKKKPSFSSLQATRKIGSALTDQPLTFKSKIKSSGYTNAPRMKAFTPKVNPTKTIGKKPKIGAKTSLTLSEREYPTDSDHPTLLTNTLSCTDRPSTINSCCFSGCGLYVTCACSDKNAYAMRMPLSSRKTHAFVGHNNSVLSASWSQSGEWLISSSKDRSARVWSLSHKDPLLCLDKTHHNLKESSDTKTQGNKLFNNEITWAQFYYLDKFIILVCGNSLHLYKYHLDTNKPDDIKRYQSQTCYKLVTSLSMESAQSITTMAAINDFHSRILNITLATTPDIRLLGKYNLVLAAGSNKAVEVFDMNVGQSVRLHTDAHTRAPHCLQQNKGSRFVSHPLSAYDLYLTAAVTDGVKLWDLRADRCVSRFTSHQNQALPVSATFSPCGRFIATGSEDKCAYVYDILSSAPLYKLRGHSNTVSTVAYHPLRPMLVTGTVDGTLRIFGTS